MKKQYKQSILDKEKRKDTSNAVRRHLYDEPILCEKKFNPLVYH